MLLRLNVLPFFPGRAMVWHRTIRRLFFSHEYDFREKQAHDLLNYPKMI